MCQKMYICQKQCHQHIKQPQYVHSINHPNTALLFCTKRYKCCVMVAVPCVNTYAGQMVQVRSNIKSSGCTAPSTVEIRI
jgi:hypothetical protein